MVEIGRLLTAMVTPFDKSGEVDYDAAKRLASALIDSGSDGLVVTGTTGESRHYVGGEDQALGGGESGDRRPRVGDSRVRAATARPNRRSLPEKRRGWERMAPCW